MRVGLLSSAWLPVPPDGYGGIENVIADLISGAKNLKIDFSLFSLRETIDKKGLAAKIPVGWHFENGLYGEISVSPNNIFYESAHAISARTWFENQSIELIHDHAGVVSQSVALMADSVMPTLITLHGPLDFPWVQDFYRLFRGAKHVYFNSISDSQRLLMPDLNYIGTIYNGIDTEKFPFSPRSRKKDYCLVMGRITPDKGQSEAIEVARKSGCHLVIAGHIENMEYWNAKIEPEIDIFLNAQHDPVTALREILAHGHRMPLVIYFGEADFAQKCKLYGSTKCTLMPISWEEPFGLVMIESMACGTPVIGFRRGAVPEIVKDGLSGFVTENVGEMLQALQHVEKILPIECRRYVEHHFSSKIMARNYYKAYLDILRTHTP